MARVIAGLEKEGKGILLMRDAQPVVARALPQLIAETQGSEIQDCARRSGKAAGYDGLCAMIG